jgi:hypothetical protein
MACTATETTASAPLKPQVDNGKTFADALAFLKKAKHIAMVVPHNGPFSRWDYVHVSRQRAKEFLGRRKPEDPLYSSFHHNNDMSPGFGASLFIGSADLTIEDHAAPVGGPSQ